MKKIEYNNRLKRLDMIHERNLIQNHKNQNEIHNQGNSQHKLLTKIIEVIEEKNYYMLGPEKTKIAKFIVENVIEIYNILKSNMESQ